MISRKSIITSFLVCFITFIALNSANAFAPKKNLLPSDYDTGISWKQAIKSEKLIAVNFYVDWCGYCRKFAPVLEVLRKKYKDDVQFVLINTEDPRYEKVAREYNIRSFPSFYLVNPRNDNRVFVNQSLYGNAGLMSKEIDRFIRLNK